jgi:arylsulfatase
MPEASVVNLKNGSYRITAEVVTAGHATGVIACQGGNMAGWSLYLDQQGHPTYHYNCFGHDHTSVRSPAPLRDGAHQIVVELAYDGGFGQGGQLTLSVDGEVLGGARLERTVPLVFSMSGETFDVGVDTGSPVGPYPHGYPCTAEITAVTLERLDSPPPEVRQAMREGELRASLSTQ